MRKGNAVGDEILIATYNSKNRTVSDEHLSEIFSAVGARYGYGDVRAEFAALKDFKVRWQRSYNWAVFTVSDYLDRAPDAVPENLAEVLFSKINGQNMEYGDVFLEYITDKKLMKQNRKDYLKRSKTLSKDSIGEFHDLNDCVNRMRDLGLIPDDLECVLTWDSSVSARVAACSVLQGVVAVSKELDRKGIPEHVLDCCVYSQMCRLMMGFNSHDEVAYVRMCTAHPMAREATIWLNEHGMYL